MGFSHAAAAQALAATQHASVEVALEWLLAQPPDEVVAPAPTLAAAGAAEEEAEAMRWLSQARIHELRRYSLQLGAPLSIGNPE